MVMLFESRNPESGILKSKKTLRKLKSNLIYYIAYEHHGA